MTFNIDWSATNIDGNNTINSGGESIGVNVSTPRNGDNDQWSVQNGTLYSVDVCRDELATLNFDQNVSNVCFTLFDVDRIDEVTILAYDSDGNLVPVTFEATGAHTVNGNSVYGNTTNNPGPGGSNPSQDIQVTIAGPIAKLVIIHDDGPASGDSGAVAVSDISFELAGPDLDGIVQGTAGDDIIDVAYTGDPEGDMIDNNDAILPGEVGDDDIVHAGDGNDTVYAGDGNDFVLGQDGDDTLHGEDGDDVLCGNDGDDTIYGGAGNDILEGMNGNDILDGGAGNDTLYGDAGNDVLTGGTGTNTLLGGTGDDTFIGGAGADSFSGGAGQDNLDYSGSGAAVNVDLSTGTLSGGDADNDTIVGGIDGVIGSDYDDTLIGFNHSGSTPADTFSNELFGGAGDDHIEGRDGDDLLEGGTGTDTIIGGDGADTISGNADADTIVGATAGDVVDGGSAGVDNDTLDLRGLNFVLEDLRADSNNNGQDGTVVFTDTNGVPTGETMTFTEIENILGDPFNFAPEAMDDSYDLNEDGSVTFNPLLNDTDPNGDTLTLDGASDPAHGTITDNGNGTYTYTPDANYNGPDSVTYTVSDGNGGTDTATVTFNVAPVNDAPDAVVDTITTDEDTPVTIDVLNNDTDVEGDPLTITGATVSTAQGTVQIVGGELLFTPADDFNGPATISYSITDGNGGTDTATVNVNVTPVNDDPIAVDDAIDTDEDVSVTIDLVGNDTDVDGDPLTIGTVSVDPAFGTVTDNGNGTATFTPALNYNGPVTIDYTVVDGAGGSDAGQATVNVGSVNDGPTANDDSDVTDEDTAITVDLTGNDTDPDGDTLQVTSVSVPAAQGTVVNNNDGTATFTPAADFHGEVTIDYSVTDGNGGTSSATHTVTVNSVNDDPVAVDDIETTDEDQPITIDLVGNDTDVDGDPLTIGTVSVDPAFGTVTDNGDGTATYNPAPNYNGPVTITYTVVDGQGGEDTGQAIVSVGAVNDAPIANDDTDTTLEDTAITVDLIGNDTDPDGDPLTVIAASVPAGQGTLVDNGDGTVTFTPAADFNGDVAISYEISDGQGGTDTGTHTVTVTPDGDAPVAVDDTASTDEDTPVTIDVLANDTDADGDTPEIVGTPTALHGTVTVNPDGTLEYTPDDDFNGNDTITYVVGDGNGGTDTGEVAVTVAPVNDDPVAVDDAGTTDYETPVTLDVVANDTDVDGDTPVITGTPTSPNGTVDVNPDGTITFTPDDGFEGDAVITYEITDGNGGTDTGEATVTVGANPQDGIVSGTAGDDLIDYDYTGDPEGDLVDHNDEILPGEGPNDDIIIAGAGNDTILAGEGNDDIDGGTGNDTIDGGVGDDEISGGDGVDTITGGAGSDTVDGGDGDDVIDTSGPNSTGIDARPDDAYPGTVPDDLDPNDDKDVVSGGAGNDTITTGDDDDIIDGGAGNDTIDAGIDDDTIDGGAGNDTIVGGEGSDTIDGGTGDDVIYGGLDPSFPDALNIPDDGSGPFGPDLLPGNGMDVIHGGDGNDTIYGADDDDMLFGDAGNDTIDGGIDDDTIDGGSGDDTLLGGQGDDTITGGTGDDSIDGGIGADIMSGGDDKDTFSNINAGDVVDGGEGGVDFDTLDLTGSRPVDGTLRVIYDAGNPENGHVDFRDSDGNVINTMEFSNIENVIPCFTPGTLIATAKGERLVEELVMGDKIITRDNGIQEIRWVGEKKLGWQDLAANPHLKPILIKKGSLGNDLPERDMMVSPNHRMLVANDKTMLYFEEREVLAAAKHLVNNNGVQTVDTMGTSYLHFMFDNHEVVLSDGTWTESFQPGDYTLQGIGNAQRAEILELFPELETAQGIKDYQSARKTLKAHEARLLAK